MESYLTPAVATRRSHVGELSVKIRQAVRRHVLLTVNVILPATAVLPAVRSSCQTVSRVLVIQLVNRITVLTASAVTVVTVAS